MVVFDSKKHSHKRPFGAIEAGTEVFFALKIRRDIVVKDVHIVVKYDRHQEPARYRMNQLMELSGDEFSDGEGERVISIAAAASEQYMDYANYAARVSFQDTGLYWYYFHVETDLGQLYVGRSVADDSAVIIDRAQSQEMPVPWQQTVYREKYEGADWIRGGVFYHIFVDRFCSGKPSESEKKEEHHGIVSGTYQLPEKIHREDWGGMPNYLPDENGCIWNNDFFGGDLAGIIKKLPYLKDLGVTCLYLSPIFEAYSNHKYDTADYLRIDPAFGTEFDFERLCRKARKLGIRVILDGVFAHTGADSVYFNKYRTYGDGGAWQDQNSIYRSWYFFNDDGSYDSWWGIDTLPKVNKKNQMYMEFITGRDGVARKWLEMGAAGWRLDVADELPVDFMKTLSKAVHTEKTDALLIGEVWEDASNKSAYDERKNYFEGDKLDSVMNYPLKNAIIDYVRNGNAFGLALTMERLMENYPKFAIHSLMNNLGTHDSCRILTALAGESIETCLETRAQQAETSLSPEEYARGKELLKAAVLLQMTLPGVPCVYYGDEAGMEGYGDPFNRKCYPWGNEDQELLSWYRKTIALRHGSQVYREGGYKTIYASEGIYAFTRFDAATGEEMITVVHLGSEDKTIADIFGQVDSEELKLPDLISGSKVGFETMVHPGDLMLLHKKGSRKDPKLLWGMYSVR